jgi:hypothetical protein
MSSQTVLHAFNVSTTTAKTYPLLASSVTRSALLAMPAVFNNKLKNRSWEIFFSEIVTICFTRNSARVFNSRKTFKMPRRKKVKLPVSLEEPQWGVIALKVMFRLMKERIEFCSDDFQELALAEGLPQEIIAKYAGATFKKMQKIAAIRKTKRARLNRLNSSVCPIWRTTNKIQKVQ